ncbi:hypothetical protein WICPIJ_002907 [Wickerhamomyces pijperi]|uniref:3',5'-cyclic-nucleotide phosphodiesterase n=1 Tax=Wickerhamomyces pijperi TaxID=599730 RepID=A0A9P8Q8A7_WICPI|nr:hypothetical protein WICPIJ_002907 [Wickerhamomyces pijperi]
MHTFEITVLGSSGGPLEGSTCSILVKPSNITYEEIIHNKVKDCLAVIDAGSFMGKLCDILNDEIYQNPVSLTQRLLNNYTDTLTLGQFKTNENGVVVKSELGLRSLGMSPMELTFTIQELANTYLITHSHLDHVLALGINSAAYGSSYPKQVYGLPLTIDGLQDHIFNDVLWPDLTSIKDPKFLQLIKLQESTEQYQQINSRYRTIPFILNHGKKTTAEPFLSTSFLIEDIETNQHVLIFGDVESDQDSNETRNLQIWKFIKPLVRTGKLNTIIIECSTPNVLPDEPLFGHLTPNSLFAELLSLNSILLETGEETTRDSQSIGTGDDIESALKGLNILITHVKERKSPIDPKKVILSELNELNRNFGLGVNFVMLLTGQTYLVDDLIFDVQRWNKSDNVTTGSDDNQTFFNGLLSDWRWILGKFNTQDQPFTSDIFDIFRVLFLQGVQFSLEQFGLSVDLLQETWLRNL